MFFSFLNKNSKILEILKKFFWGEGGIILGGVGDDFLFFPYPIFFCTNLLVRVKLGYPPNFNILGKLLRGEKFVLGRRKKKKEKRIMPSLVATTFALTRTTFTPTKCLQSTEPK